MGNRPAKDAVRDLWLKAHGFEVLRIPALDVLRSAVNVAEAVLSYCKR